MTTTFSERYRVNAPLLRWHFCLSVCLSVTRLSCEWTEDFYRAMLCIARTMPSQHICMSVCHTPVFCRCRNG